MSILVIGGTGVFGSLIVDELLASPLKFHVSAAARGSGAVNKSRRIDGRHAFVTLDLNDTLALQRTVTGHAIVILAAGPFQEISAEVALVSTRAGAHFIDINDSPAYHARLVGVADELKATGRAVLSGMSSLPGISLPLFCAIKDDFDTIDAIEIALFIGNANKKGAAAVHSALENLTTPVTVWRGGKKRTTMGWTKKVLHPFPKPIGAKPAYSFASPDPLVFPEIATFRDLTVKVSFESRMVRGLFTLLHSVAHLGWYAAVKHLIDAARPLWNLTRVFGSEWGCVSVVVKGLKDGRSLIRQAALLAPESGQRLAALPSVLAAEALARGTVRGTGLVGVDLWMKPKEFLEKMQERGFRLVRGPLS